MADKILTKRPFQPPVFTHAPTIAPLRNPDIRASGSTMMNTMDELTNDEAMGGDDDEEDEEDEEDDEEGQKKRPRGSGTSGSGRPMSDNQKFERRERNREHAKRSRVRKKFLLDSLQQSVRALQDENDRLRVSIRTYLPEEADELLQGTAPSCLATSSADANTVLNDPDYSLVKALQTAQQSFIITDPSLPDNPLVYASGGFLELTGYTIDQVLGRNCRFLQGPNTDLRAVDRIRRGIEKGEDTTVVLLNYRADGTMFWNQFFVAALRDGDGNIVNFLGVQCKVSEEYALAFLKKQKIDDANNALRGMQLS